MSNLAQLLTAGTARFNALRSQGEVSADHSGTTLSGLFFARADLSKLDLSNAEFEDCTVSDVDFASSDLRGAFIHGGRYEKCDFRGANLEGATLENVEFVECDFTGALGLDTLELEDVKGLGATAPEAQDLEDSPAFTPGHVAVNEALEKELDANPHDEKRWLVYADWLQAEGDLRGELITRQHRGEGFEAFVNEHLDQLFPGCADEIRGGGQIPELELEWRHGFVIGATSASLNAERAVNLAEVVSKLLPLPVCRFIRRLSFGLNHGVTLYGENTNDYAPVVRALITQPRLARLHRLEFGVQEPEIDEDYGEPEPLHAWGDLSALWPHVPQLRELLVKGSEGILGELVLPELRSVTLMLELAEDSEVFSEVLAARWPKLERFELLNASGGFELEPFLHVLSTLPLKHLALPHTDELMPLLKALLQSPVLKRLEVLDLNHSTMRGPALAWLEANSRSFSHLKRLDLTGAADAHEEEALSRLGDFIVIRPPEEEEREAPDLDDWEEADPTPGDGEAPEAPNADLDIPDEHGD